MYVKLAPDKITKRIYFPEKAKKETAEVAKKETCKKVKKDQTPDISQKGNP